MEKQEEVQKELLQPLGHLLSRHTRAHHQPKCGRLEDGGGWVERVQHIHFEDAIDREKVGHSGLDVFTGRCACFAVEMVVEGVKVAAQGVGVCRVKRAGTNFTRLGLRGDGAQCGREQRIGEDWRGEL